MLTGQHEAQSEAAGAARTGGTSRKQQRIITAQQVRNDIY
jgi:hypothetical protein